MDSLFPFLQGLAPLQHAGCSENIIRLELHPPKVLTLALSPRGVASISGNDEHGACGGAFAVLYRNQEMGCCSST